MSDYQQIEHALRETQPVLFAALKAFLERYYANYRRLSP